VLRSRNWVSNLPFAKRPTASFIHPKDVINIVDKTGKLTEPEDVTPMGLANLALDLVGEEGVLPSILRRAVRMIQS